MRRPTHKLAEKAPSHSNRPDFSWEYLGHVDVHGRVATGGLESKVEKDKSNAGAITSLIVGSTKASNHGCQPRSGDCNADETYHVYPTS